MKNKSRDRDKTWKMWILTESVTKQSTPRDGDVDLLQTTSLLQLLSLRSQQSLHCWETCQSPVCCRSVFHLEWSQTTSCGRRRRWPARQALRPWRQLSGAEPSTRTLRHRNTQCVWQLEPFLRLSLKWSRQTNSNCLKILKMLYVKFLKYNFNLFIMVLFV